MKKSILTLAALAFMAWGCSSGGDDTTDPTPDPSNESKPTLIAAGTDTRPLWQMPNFDYYEQVMMVDVQLQDELVAYASTQDLLCALINDEVCGVATAEQNDSGWQFPLAIASNEANVPIVLSYYCDKLHRIFTINWTTFDATVAPTGTGGIYKPIFLQ